MSDSMLSQEEVDNLFKQATGKSIVHAASSAPSEKPAVRPAVVSEPAVVNQPVAQAPRQAAPPTAPVAPAPVISRPMAPAPQEIRPRPAAPAPVAVNIVPQQRSDASIERLQTMISDLTGRLLKAEKKILQLEQNRPSQPFVSQSKDLERLEDQVEDIRVKLEATPGYNASNLFTCSSCGTSGQIAAPIKCTHCGEEGWWGWWPRDSV